jgi:hypothetical protein
MKPKFYKPGLLWHWPGSSAYANGDTLIAKLWHAEIHPPEQI